MREESATGQKLDLPLGRSGTRTTTEEAACGRATEAHNGRGGKRPVRTETAIFKNGKYQKISRGGAAKEWETKVKERDKC